MLLYANTSALKDEHLIEENGFKPGDISHLVSITRFSDSATPEDLHFISPVILPDSTDISTSTYITAAFYDWEMRYGAYQGFHLVATDQHKYHFQTSAPSSTPPLPPADMTFSFDNFHSVLEVDSPLATDPDTTDTSLSYEFAYTTSTEFSPDIWYPVGRNTSTGMNVVFGNAYKIGVRTADDFGNISEPIARTWNDFPASFVITPSQGEASQNIGNSDGSGQRVLIEHDANISRVAMVMRDGGGMYSVTDTYMNIYSDNNGALGDIIGSSGDIPHQWPMGGSSPEEFIFTFTTPVNLSANKYYWLVPVNGPGISNNNVIFGSPTDAYPDGYWSGNPGADAYFFLR